MRVEFTETVITLPFDLMHDWLTVMPYICYLILSHCCHVFYLS